MAQLVSLLLCTLILTSCFKTAQQMEQGQTQEPYAKEDEKFMKNANLNTDVEEAKLQIQKLHGANSDLQIKLDEVTKENEALRNRLTAMEENFQKFQDSTTKNMADVIADISLLDERTAQGNAKAKDRRKAETKKKSENPTAAGDTVTPTPVSNNTQIAGADLPSTEPQEKKESPIDEAIRLMKEKKYPEAVNVLEEPLKGKSKYRDLLLYFHGEALYKMKDYKRSIVSHDEVVQKYKGSSKWSKSVQRVAESFERLGMKDEAKAYRSLLK